MNKTKDCKVLFNTLIQRSWKKDGEESKDSPLYQIGDIINYTIKQSRKHRFYDLQDNKFCFLESANKVATEDETIILTGLFKSARNEFRPDLINKKTGVERKNPKEITEGDIQKTHFIIKIDKNAEEVYLFLEYNFHGLNMNNIINYLTFFDNKYLKSKDKKKSYSIKYLIIPRKNFLTELDAIKRTRLAEIYFDKQLLGSRALNFSNRVISLKKDLKLIASASAKESITDVAIDFYNALNKKNSVVSKVRIYGNDEENNEVILDTSFMSKVEFIEVDINQETGEVNSTQLFTGLKKIAKSF